MRFVVEEAFFHQLSAFINAKTNRLGSWWETNTKYCCSVFEIDPAFYSTPYTVHLCWFRALFPTSKGEQRKKNIRVLHQIRDLRCWREIPEWPCPFFLFCFTISSLAQFILLCQPVVLSCKVNKIWSVTGWCIWVRALVTFLFSLLSPINTLPVFPHHSFSTFSLSPV